MKWQQKRIVVLCASMLKILQSAWISVMVIDLLNDCISNDHRDVLNKVGF